MTHERASQSSSQEPFAGLGLGLWEEQKRLKDVKKTLLSSDFNSEQIVIGYSCHLINNAHLAASINDETFLVSWNGDERLKIDRCDIRSLSSSEREFQKRRKFSYDFIDMIPEHDRDEFDFLQSERYYYLNNQDIQSENPLILLESSNKEGVAAYLKDCERDFKLCANFASDRPSLPSEPPLELEREEIYDGPTAKCLAEGRALPIDRQSRPPMPCYDFEIPDSIQWIPINKGVFIIIKKTCEFVTAFGTSYEIALKAVLKDNPLVAFLFKEHPLYPFYKFICERLSKKESVNLKDDAGVCDSEEKSIKTEDVSFNEKLHSESKTASLVQYQVSDEENSDATGGARGLKGSQEIPRSPRTTVKGCCSPSEKEQSVVIQLKKNSDKDVNNVFLDYSSESGDEKINKEAVGNKHKHKTGSVRHARADEDDRESQDSQSFGMKLDDLLEKSYQMSKKKHKHETSKSSSSKNRSRSRSKRTRKDRSSHRASKRRKRSRRRSRSRS